jgi:hypothetical protein
LAAELIATTLAVITGAAVVGASKPSAHKPTVQNAVCTNPDTNMLWDKVVDVSRTFGEADHHQLSDG